MVTTSAATITETAMFRGGGGRGEGKCGGGGSSDGGGDNGDDDKGGGDNDNDSSDDNDDGGDDKDDDISNDDHNGGNGGNSGGGCNTSTVVGIDRQVNNQLKVAMDNRRGRTRGGGRGHGQRRPWFINVLVSFFYFAFCEECGLGTTQSVRKSFFSRKKSSAPFLQS